VKGESSKVFFQRKFDARAESRPPLPQQSSFQRHQPHTLPSPAHTFVAASQLVPLSSTTQHLRKAHYHQIWPLIPSASPSRSGLTAQQHEQQASTQPAHSYAFPLPLRPGLANNFKPQFSLGFFFFIDAATYSKSNKNGSDFHINFVDWIPGICSALGMLVINSIDKTRLGADSFSYSGNGVAWKARLVLFLGFALLAGGLAGSVTVLVLKYLVNSVVWPTLWFGVANVVANAMIMTRYVSFPS
jgi:hypothetical protein